MLATSPASSPQLRSTASSSSIHFTRPSSNSSSSYAPSQNAASSPRIGSSRKPQDSSPSSAGARYKTKDASTQYSPQEQESRQANKEGKDQGTISGTSNMSATPKTQGANHPLADQRAPESPAVKRALGDASLQPGDSKSPSKRAKPQSPMDKLLPAQYDRCDPADLVVMLSQMMDDLVRINDPLQLKTTKLTRFHSRVAPGISVQSYLHRLTTHLVLQPTILLTMCFYVDRLCSYYPEFTVNSLTCHRFCITAATVATKGLSDAFWNNSTYARVGGVKLSELALLELEFLYRVDWRIIPDNDTLKAYYRGLITRTAGYSLAPPAPPAPPNLSNRPTNITSNDTSSPRISDNLPVVPPESSGSNEMNPAKKEGNASRSDTVEPNVPADSKSSDTPAQ